jgi:hypothetical protein
MVPLVTVLASTLDTGSAQYQVRRAAMLAKLDELDAEHAKALGGGGPRYVQRHRARGKLTARERIELLVDPDSPLLELSALAGYGTGFPVGGSNVTAIGVISGTECLISASDPTVRGGSTNPWSLRKSLRAMRIAIEKLCTQWGALMIADEIQSGLGRTGTTFACEHSDVVPDMYVLGKALGGGIVPISAVVSSAEVLGVFKPGQHGSTFGGNPLACAIAREVIAMLHTGEYQERSAKLGTHMRDRLSALPPGAVREVRGLGLWAGVEFTELNGREVTERLMAAGVLAKDTHGCTIRLAPPLVITQDELDWAIDQLEAVVR